MKISLTVLEHIKRLEKLAAMTPAKRAKAIAAALNLPR